MTARPYRSLLGPIARLAGRQPAMSGNSQPEPAVDERRRSLDVEAFATPEAQAIARRVNEVDEWYHVIDLPHGVSTPGRADHRRQVHRYGLPDDMRGLRALDVASFDGFWAFEMERRGAEVVAIDLGRWSQADLPLRLLEQMRPEDDRRTGAGFRVARDLLGSKVDRREVSVYDLRPEDLGTFDLVFMSDLLLHLRDPQRALERLFPLVRPNGIAIIAEPYNPDLEGFGETAVTQYVAYHSFVWWIPSTTTLTFMLKVAGFEPEEIGRFRLDYQHPFPVEKVVLKARPAGIAAVPFKPGAPLATAASDSGRS